nr:Protein CYN-17, isoform a [Haemonchus contortus]
MLLMRTMTCYDTRQAQVNRAIEETKSRQMTAPIGGRVPNRPSQNTPGRNEAIDVDKLNQLIRALDKTWVLPRPGAKEPVGSNFQYKKTCASIFKARHGACQQLSFGVMCFNYCHERGEKLSFKCQDASDAAYCRQSGTFETFLAKYRKDGYKAKAYIHQMISRCYATAICNTQTGILNSTIITEEEMTETTTRPSNRSRTTRSKPTTTRPPVTVSSSKNNIWDRFTVSQNSKVSSKYIPFWKRLLSTTVTPSTPDDELPVEVEGSPEVEEEPKLVVDTEEFPKEETTPKKEVTSTASPTQKAISQTELPKETRSSASSERHTFKPLPMTVPPIAGPELAFQKAGGRGPGFWNRFQPNRWFESIHYVTNTGK